MILPLAALVIAYAIGYAIDCHRSRPLWGSDALADWSREIGATSFPRVINGGADLLVELFGDRGKPTRAAIGCQGLGGNASVEVIVTLLFSGSEVRAPLARDQFVK